MSSSQSELKQESEQTTLQVSDSMSKVDTQRRLMDKKKDDKPKAKKKNVSRKQTQDLAGLMRDDIIRYMREDMAFQVDREIHKINTKKAKSDIKRTLKHIAIKREYLETLQQTNNRLNCAVKDCLKNIVKSSEQPKALKSLSEEIKRITEEKWTIEGDNSKTEEVLNEYKKYKTVMFTLLCLEWQDTQTQNEENTEPQGAAESMDLESRLDGVLPSAKEATLSSPQGDTLLSDLNLNSDSAEHEKNLKGYLSDYQKLVDIMSDRTHQNLSLIQNSKNTDKVMEQTIETTKEIRKKVLEDEERLVLKENDMKDRIDREKKRAIMLRDLVEVHESLKSLDQDIMMEDLMRKMKEVYFRCVDRRITNLSTLEKLSSTESRMLILLQRIESIPEELLMKLRFSKESTRRSRLHEEQLRKELEKRMEMRKRCFERSMGPPRKITGRRLMPRCIPVKSKAEASEQASDSTLEDLHTYLFNEDSD